jgi:hypothetical protein
MRGEIVSGVDFADYGFSDHRVTGCLLFSEVE